MVKGRGHTRVASPIMPTVVSVNAAPTIHAAGRHRRERSRPSGKSKNTNASMAIAITEIQFDSQANARPAGTDPGAATRAWCAEESEKAHSPTARPAAKHSQP